MYGRIVVGVAKTDSAKRAIDVASDLAERYGAELHLVMVLSPAAWFGSAYCFHAQEICPELCVTERVETKDGLAILWRCPCAGANTDMHVSVRTKAIAAPPMSRMTLAPVRPGSTVSVCRASP